MRQTLTPRTRRLLDIQGFDAVDVQELAPVAPWLRLTFGLCGLLGGMGTLMASPTILLMLALIAALAAASPVHPFDLIYNYGIRHFTGTGPLPRRGLPTRFGCGMGAVLVLVTAWAFSAGHQVTGYALGGALTFVVLLVSTTDICIPSLIYRSIFGWPRARDTQPRMIAMARPLFVLNDESSGTERGHTPIFR
ncbi:MAG: DUF4395 family protein [Vicinamibacterales bacterium]